MIHDLHILKSFVSVGRSLAKCYGCIYCRANSMHREPIHLSALPSEINPIFTALPVAINLWYGDPMLQVGHTVDLLERLERARHTGPIALITRGPLSKMPRAKFDLNLVYCLSTFGRDHSLSGRSWADFRSDLDWCQRAGVLYSIEYRPIIHNINDQVYTIARVLRTAQDHGVGVAYSGLQGTPDVVARWRAEGYDLQPYPGHKLGYKKSVAPQVEDTLRRIATQLGVPVYSRTSCAISAKLRLHRDYNAHYHRPNEVGCTTCPMHDRCMAYKDAPDIASCASLPYAHEVIYKQRHTCAMVRDGTCESPTPDCSQISGHIITTDERLTTADVRATKWLTGMTVDAPFYESPYLSDFWRV